LTVQALMIGGITFHFHYDDEVRLEIAAEYKPFFKPLADNQKAPDMDVFLRLHTTMPETAGMNKVFDSQSAVTIYEDNGFIISNTIPGDDSPEWLTKISPDFTNAIIYCSPGLYHCQDDVIVLDNPLRYPLDQLLIMNLLADKQGLLVHGAVVGVDDQGFIFPGVSGSGKSTLSGILSRNKDWTILTDDRAIIQTISGVDMVFGTPWTGEGNWVSEAGLNLKAMVFLRKGDKNQMETIDRRTAIEKLIPVVSIPWYRAGMVADCLDVCDHLMNRAPLFEMEFTPDERAADVFKRFAASF